MFDSSVLSLPWEGRCGVRRRASANKKGGERVLFWLQ
uniref:Uncharacterized protein n=1 Tax=Anguilla anguilla TaxID=7936 RepID=A0A0E9TMJ0_ANGAN